ncbi:hypothetical protein GHNINEIG_01431 [Hydrogenovibrio crunogenus]|uniref:Uncharacterized protein n=1 Tax=Hydrogenovibrio crunogenus TaxID=39765 RepID=A0A4P7P002_9GAMM|nr:hypothetical protein [Hydrogenovibrio crunogenus]QBZ83377.1 hypothetical protein GHNINEIG_01431 [Hydrogenovibrio crunogenus]
MFCLFKNSKIAYPFNWIVLLLSLAGVAYWLHFAFIEKEFLMTMFEGQALFVDLLLGLPVVLIFAVVVYAMIFWLLKVLIILFLPQMIIQLEARQSELSDELDPSLGEAYWQQEDRDATDAETSSKSSQEDASDSTKK